MGFNSAFKGLMIKAINAKVRIIFTLEQAMNAQRRSRGITLLFL